MPANTSTLTSLVNNGNREDINDTITRVAVEDTPFYSLIGNSKANATYNETQTETLAAPDATNAQLEGNQTINTNSAPNLTTRIGNITQIFAKVGEVSYTQQAVRSAGNSGSLDRQKVLKGIECRRDVEIQMVANRASNVQSGTTPRRLGGALAWLSSNVSRGTGGANGGFAAGIVAAATNGTQRTFTEALVKTVMATAFTNGAKPSIMMMGPVLKQTASTFSGIAQQRAEVKGANMATIIGAADVYVSDYGDLKLVPHPYATDLNRAAFLVDPKMWAKAVLTPFTTESLAKTGLADEFQIFTELTLECKNERGSGVIADLS